MDVEDFKLTFIKLLLIRGCTIDPIELKQYLDTLEVKIINQNKP